jgi:hypothetical protein
MKIIEYSKKLWFIFSLVLIGAACLLFLFNHFSYKEYLEMKEKYVEVDCTVIEVDDIKRTIKIAYIYNNFEYYTVFETTEYKLMDTFTGVIRPEDPTKLRFDNGYDVWNLYSYIAVFFLILAAIIDIAILKRIFIKSICMRKDKINTKVIEIKTWKSIHYIIVLHEGKEYKSELFKTFEDISLLEENVYIDLYINKSLHYIDLSTYKKRY